jgi:hypothetical protein
MVGMDSRTRPLGWGWWALAWLVLATGFCVTYAAMSRHREQARAAAEREATAVAAITSPGGVVIRDDNALGKPVVGANLSGTQVTDATLAHLTSLRHLRVLNLHDTQVTDAGLAHVEVLSRLEELNLARTAITDAGLVYVKGLKHLQTLDLRGTRVTGAGIARLETALPRTRVVWNIRWTSRP